MDSATNVKQQVTFVFLLDVILFTGFRNSLSLWSGEFEHHTEENLQWREPENKQP
jgi:hypothetical protein